jgi:hypothetical protein
LIRSRIERRTKPTLTITMLSKICASIKSVPLEKYKGRLPLYVIGTMYNVVNKSNTRPTQLGPKAREMMIAIEDKNKRGEEPTIDFFQQYRKTLYHDDAVRLHKDEVLSTSFCGKPVFVEHKKRIQVGTVVAVTFPGGGSGSNDDRVSASSSSSPSNDDLLVLVKITDPKIANEICDKRYTAFSVGYSFRTTHNYEIVDKQFQEVSIVEDPFFKGCEMSILASNSSQSYGSIITPSSSEVGMDLHHEPPSFSFEPPSWLMSPTEDQSKIRRGMDQTTPRTQKVGGNLFY